LPLDTPEFIQGRKAAYPPSQIPPLSVLKGSERLIAVLTFNMVMIIKYRHHIKKNKDRSKNPVQDKGGDFIEVRKV